MKITKKQLSDSINLLRAIDRFEDAELKNRLLSLIGMLDGWKTILEAANKAIEQNPELLEEPPRTSAYKSAQEALEALPEKDELVLYLKQNFIRYIENESRPFSLYYIDQATKRATLAMREVYVEDCDTAFVQRLLYELERNPHIKDERGIVRRFHDVVGGYFTKELRNGVSLHKFDKSVVDCFVRSECCLGAIPKTNKIRHIVVGEGEEIGIESLDKTKFTNGRSLVNATHDQFLKNSLIRWLAGHYPHLKIIHPESPANTLCRFIGKYLHRHIDLPSPSTLQQREIFFLQGAGRTGISTFLSALVERLSNVAESMDNSLEYADSHSTSKLVGKSLGVVTELNQSKGSRVIRSRALRRITCGDPITINPKNKAPYTTQLFFTVLIGVNDYPKCNASIADEFTRFYIMETRQPKANDQDIKRKYAEDIDEFFGFCYELYMRYRDLDNGDLLYKPDAMVQIIFKHCIPDEFNKLKRLHDLMVQALERGIKDCVTFAEKDIAKDTILKVFEKDRSTDYEAMREELEFVLSRSSGSVFSWKKEKGLYLTFDLKFLSKYQLCDYLTFLTKLKELVEKPVQVQKEIVLDL